MLAVRTSTTQSGYVENEWSTIWSTSIGGPFLIWCHGNNQTAISDYTSYNAQLRLLAQRFTVVSADLGGSTFGNDTAMDRVDSLMTYLGASEAYFVGASMGGVVALNYALRHPEKVTALAGIIPGIDLNDAVVRGTGAATNINLAYNTYNDEVHGPTHSPIRYANELDSSIPMHMWASENDTTCPYAITQEFCVQSGAGLTSLGNQGHGGITIAVPQVYDWLNYLRG